MSSSDFSTGHGEPVTSLLYHDIEAGQGPLQAAHWSEMAILQAAEHGSAESYSKEQLQQRIVQVRAETVAEVEARLRQEYEGKLSTERLAMVEAVANFKQQREEYYSRVESELVQLALAIAGKILHREVQIDRMLLAALARVAVENLQHRSNVIIRVRPDECERWRDYFQMHLRGSKVEILEDSQLKDCDCVLETELGTADVSIDAQLKEIERGFFDLLAQRPGER